MNRFPSRPLSTSARVHPRILPYLQPKPARMPSTKLLPAVAVVAAVGYGIATYRESHAQRAQADQAMLELEEIERRRKNKMLDDAYGDRTNLDELEKAMQLYESQHRDH